MSKQDAVAPLDTRHVFLDTQVYRKLGYNVANPALRSLAKHIEVRKVVLHITDLTLLEIKRHILEEVEAKARELATIEKTLRRWRHSFSDISQAPTIDATAVAAAIYRTFEQTVLRTWSTVNHSALDVAPSAVFEDYFSRKPPFDQDGSKEFPDAFMLKALTDWCVANRATMHVISQDKAMQRAAAASDHLVPIQTIEEVLARASVQPDVNSELVADEVVSAPEFDHFLELAIEDLGTDLVFVYHGDLPEGEVVNHDVGSIEAVTAYSLAWVGSTSVALILTAETNVLVSVQYEDRSLAMYDREDDRWFGGDSASTEIEVRVPIEIFVEIDLATRQFIMYELMRDEYMVSEGYSWPDHDTGYVR
jgi:PIN domain